MRISVCVHLCVCVCVCSVYGVSIYCSRKVNVVGTFLYPWYRNSPDHGANMNDQLTTRITGRECEKKGWFMTAALLITLQATMNMYRIRQLVSWCFKPSQPQRIRSGLRETFIQRYLVKRTNKAELRPEEQHN